MNLRLSSWHGVLCAALGATAAQEANVNTAWNGPTLVTCDNLNDLRAGNLLSPNITRYLTQQLAYTGWGAGAVRSKLKGRDSGKD